MKANRILGFFLLILVANACKKDDPKDLIIGTWQAQNLVVTNCSNPDDNQELAFSSGCYTESSVGVQICISANFSANGTYDFTIKSTFLGSTTTDKESGTYSIDGNSLTLCPQGDSCEDNQFTISENSLVLTSIDSDNNCNSKLTMEK